MATKPDVTLSRWADTSGTYINDPSNGARDTGFVGGTPALAKVVNALLYRAYKWFGFLDDLFTSTGEHKFPERTVSLGPLGLSLTNWAPNTDGAMASSGAGSYVKTLSFNVGERVKSIKLRLFGDGSVDLTGQLFRKTGYDGSANTGAQLASLASPTTGSASNIPAGVALTDLTYDIADTTLAANDLLQLTITASATGLRVHDVLVTFDRPV